MRKSRRSRPSHPLLVDEVSRLYTTVYQRLTGEPFVPDDRAEVVGTAHRFATPPLPLSPRHPGRSRSCRPNPLPEPAGRGSAPRAEARDRPRGPARGRVDHRRQAAGGRLHRPDGARRRLAGRHRGGRGDRYRQRPEDHRRGPPEGRRRRVRERHARCSSGARSSAASRPTRKRSTSSSAAGSRRRRSPSSRASSGPARPSSRHQIAVDVQLPPAQGRSARRGRLHRHREHVPARADRRHGEGGRARPRGGAPAHPRRAGVQLEPPDAPRPEGPGARPREADPPPRGRLAHRPLPLGVPRPRASSRPASSS